jgi:acyl-CoA thioesterase-1
MLMTLRIACAGDSITYGYGVQNNRLHEAWPALLQQALPDCMVKSFGVCGAQASQDGELPYAETAEYRQSLAFHPDLVLLMLGTNDCREESYDPAVCRSGLLSLAHSYQPARVILIIPPAGSFPAFSHPFGVSLDLLNRMLPQVIRAAAAEAGLGLIDLSAKRISTVDGIHPDRIGNQQLAAAVHASMQRQGIIKN